jgi:hypothetical protein
VVSVWVSTNDTPTSGEWDPSNNTAPANMSRSAAWSTTQAAWATAT